MARVTVTNNQSSQFFVPSPIARFLGANQTGVYDGISVTAMEQSDAFVSAVAAGTITVVTVAEDPLVPDAIEASVGAAQLRMFLSADVTATGAAQNTAHGLGVVPSVVLIVPTGGDNGAGAAGTQFPTIVEGTHTATNVVATVAQGATYRVLALA